MHTKTTPGLAFDSLCPVEGSFEISMAGDEAIKKLDIRMVYYNRATTETFGSAKWTAETWSEKTMSAFKEFVKSAESDAAKILYGERDEKSQPSRPAHVWERAETGMPLSRPKGLGGT